MSELNDAFQRREREIASTVATDAGLAARLDTTAVRRRRRRQVGIAVSSIAGVGAVIGGALLFAPASQNDPVAPVESPSASATAPSLGTPAPTATEASTPQAAHIEGFAPVPQLSADQIPWDEVGPGWFLVDFHLPLSPAGSQPEDPNKVYPTGEAVGGLSLLAPDGTWYAARSFAGTGAGFTVAWDGTNAWLADEAANGVDNVVVSASLVNLKSGAEAGRVANVPYEHFVGLDDGRALVFGFAGSGTGSFVDGPRKKDLDYGCSDMGAPIYGPVQDDYSFEYLPRADGAMVCFVPRTDGRTDVMWLQVASPSGSKTLATFKSPEDRYVFLGWVTDHSFVFGKLLVGESNRFEQLFVYDVDTDGTTPIEVSAFLDHSDAYTHGYFDRQSQRFVVPTTSPGAWSVDLATLDGTAVATLSGDCSSWAKFMASGDRLVVSCEPNKHVWLFSLADGAALGEWAMEGQGALSFFDYPER